MEEIITSEEIERHYLSALDSVNLINAIVANQKMIGDSIEEKNDCMKRNVDHLKIMVAKNFMQSKDLEPLNQAIASGEKYLKI